MQPTKHTDYGPEQIEHGDSPKRPENRHQRTPYTEVDAGGEHGFIVKIVDPDPSIEGRHKQINSEIHLWIRPAPYGYRADLWWVEQEEVHHAPYRLAFENRRDLTGSGVSPTDPEPAAPTDKARNQHRREPVVSANTRSQIGYAVSIADPDPRVEGRHGPVLNDQHSLQIKPHPNGFQATLWWSEDTADGEISRQNDVHPGVGTVIERANWHPDDARPLGCWD